ncbi:MAG: ABC transporter ATP-binding protein [Gammaproteobacteria bacterium]|nr:ABC transporter ATP-binding protein [Gammaproteobacteria bacterium]
MIKAEALSRTYGDLVAVDQVSFTIGNGEIVGLLGHNGAGKTTIMKMLTGFLEPSSGTVVVDGFDPSRQRQQVQQRIGYLPENNPIYPEMSVLDYLDYAAALHGVAPEARTARIRDAIERTELTSRATALIGTLSRGYRQRVGVAQAILHQPKVLILDEPTNGLDPTQVQHMRELIRALSRQATVILSTHILQEVQAICDRVIIIRGGRKALDATMAELRAGKRLLVSIDAAPERALPLFRAVTGVDTVEALGSDGPQQRYALDLAGGHEPLDAAPVIAARIAAAGVKLYALTPETRDLETIFGQISAQGGR